MTKKIMADLRAGHRARRPLEAASVTLAAWLVLATSASCTEHKVDGRTANQEFADARVAALARAACTGDTRSIARALADGASPNFVGYEGVTPLLWAVNCENLAGIEALLKAGADPNYKPRGKFSPTFAAATMWNPEPLRLLLGHGGDPNTYYGNDTARTALSEAFEVGWNDHGWSNYDALLRAGADINQANEVGQTIATKAASLGRFDKVAELLGRGYSHDLVDLGGFVQDGEGPSDLPETAKWRAEVKTILEKKGVHFPVPPRSER